MKVRYGTIGVVLLFSLSLFASVYPAVHPESDSNINTADLAWILTASAFVLVMTPGLSFFYGGMVSRKNVISTMLQSFIALGVISVLWYAIGFSLAFGESLGGLIGNPFTYAFFNNVGNAPHPVIGAKIPFMLFAAFQLKFAIITPALITGAFAERVRFWAYMLFMALFSLFIYCPLAHWTWHPDGIFFKMGVLDFAGGTVVHISAGFAALAGALVLGKRKVYKEKEQQSPANIPFVLLGTGLLWFGWFGFNAGSSLEANKTAVTAFVNTNLASATAMLCWILVDSARGLKPSALGACIGAVVGLVAITPAAGFVTAGASIFIGVFSAAVSNYAVHWKNTRASIDDTLDVFPCHGLGGITGMLLTAVFATSGGLITGETTLFLNHLIALAITSVFTFGGSYILYKVTDKLIPLRVGEDKEFMGLDLSQHDEQLV